MKNICEGSRRRAAGAASVKDIGNRPRGPCCPVCKRTLAVSRVLGIVEFPRHESRMKDAPGSCCDFAVGSCAEAHAFARCGAAEDEG